MVASMVITSITNYLTPTVLFCILNLMIAIIFIVSNFKSPSHHHHHPPSQLVRSPSLLERVKSVNFSSFYYSHDDDNNNNNNNIIDYNNNLVSQLARPPSFLQRVRSIDLSFSSFYTPPVDVQVQSHELHNSLSQLTRVPSLIERVKSFKLPSGFNSFESDELTELTRDDSPSQLSQVPSLMERVKSFKRESPFNVDRDPLHESGQTSYDSPSQLGRVPSFLDRVKSFKLVSPFSSDHHSGAGEHSDSDIGRDPLHDFDDSETSGVTPAKTDFLTKSRSEKRWPESDEEEEEEDVDRRRPATMKAAIGGGKDECVDAKADDFIKRFKQQLKLQRLDSLQRFREMLNRGATTTSTSA